jgi:hypothetical protein
VIVAIRQGQPLTAERIKQLNAETKLYTNGKYQTYDSIPKTESTLNLRGRIAQRATLKEKGIFKGTGVGNPGTFRPGPANDLREYLKTLPNGSTVNRQKLAEEFGIKKQSMGTVTEVLKEFKDKNFKFVNPVKGILKGPAFELTATQKKLPMLLFGKTEDQLTSTQRSKIRLGTFNENTMTPYRRSKMYDPKSLKDYGKTWNELSESQKDRVREGKPPEALAPGNKVKVDKELLKLSKDSRIIDIFKNPNRTPAQVKKDVSVVKKLLGKGTNATARLTQLAAAFSGDDARPGIPIKFKANAEKLFKDLPHTKAQRELYELKIGKSVGEKSIKTIKSKIRKNPNYIFTGDYNIDEPAGVTSSIKRGTTPYGIFGQVINRKINQKAKSSFDGNKSIKEEALQKAIKTKNPIKVNKALRDFNKLVSDYEKQININTPKGLPKIKLFRATLDSPINSISNFDTFNPEYKKAFLDNFDTRGYSFKVPRDIKTIPQIAELTQDPAVIKKMTGLMGRYAPRLLSLFPTIAAGGLAYAGITSFSKLFGGTAVQAAEVQRDAQGNIIESQVKQPTVGEPLKYDATQGSIVNANTDQTADQNQILEYVKDNPLKVTAGTSLGFAAQEVPGAYKAARDLGRGRVRSTLGISGAIRPVLTTFGTPLITGLYEGAIGAKRLDEGETMTDILTDPVGPALGLTLMEPLSKLSGVVRDAPKRTMLEGAKNYFNLSNVGQARPGITGQILRMGLSPKMIAGASRFLGLPGLALGLGMSGYDAYKNYQNQEGMIYNLFNKDG